MDHLLCVNINSFPANNENEATELFTDSLQGVLELFANDDDRVVFYLDSIKDESLHSFELASSFTYADFLKILEKNNDMDLLSVLYDMIDKSPALDFLDEQSIFEMTEYSYYIPNVASHSNLEVFSMADYLSAKLLSIRTSSEWDSPQILFNKTRNGEFHPNTCLIDNISRKSHGKYLYNYYNTIDLRTICSSVLISNFLETWFNSLINEDKNIIYKKVSYCKSKDFNGGEPLFKSIQGSDGLWEIRFRAFAGGAIRILYKKIQEKTILLTGFIKKSDMEGYERNIEIAEQILNEYLSVSQ